ncbi:CRIB domain-containing protein RIC5-like [Dioscorea cayenensis subsp. rotundata]|uniref:CRIB domain-containing protein RIC5-like n=1 Tax=Dioscorea cayennensis subsp. rotundata TaxID=55577 RepID=A0AB40B4T4_DIOCR|nr:CRIB domain-containing protein RIC5-like [Dioscorea cayenensis subsp. rotundata]
MGTKVKGLLKGLRYISQIFDGDLKEQEMQIGYPTDVKHVAHIGWDCPSVGSPSWNRPIVIGRMRCGRITNRGMKNLVQIWVTKNAPPRGEGSMQRRSRRNQSAGAIDDALEGSRRRRPKSDSLASVGSGGSESLSGDLPAIPKQARRRKTKGGSGGSSRPKAAAAATEGSSCSEPGADDRSRELIPPLTTTAGEEDKL